MTTGPSDDDAASRHIDIHDPAQLEQWAKKLDATPDQLREAIEAVGNHADDIEMHLKGSRSSMNSERVAEAIKRP